MLLCLLAGGHGSHVPASTHVTFSSRAGCQRAGMGARADEMCVETPTPDNIFRHADATTKDESVVACFLVCLLSVKKEHQYLCIAWLSTGIINMRHAIVNISYLTTKIV